MFLRIGMCFGPIVEVTEDHVIIELVTPYERDGERLAIERESLLPFAKREVEIWQELTSQ